MTYVDDNAAARDRVLALVAPLTDERMAVQSESGWTIAAQLAHMAFWDRVHVGRLRAAVEGGKDLPGRMPEGATDAINDAGLYAWRLLDGTSAARLFADASAEADMYLATLDPAIVEQVRAAGSANVIERYRHRLLHGEAIEGALAAR